MGLCPHRCLHAHQKGGNTWRFEYGQPQILNLPMGKNPCLVPLGIQICNLCPKSPQFIHRSPMQHSNLRERRVRVCCGHTVVWYMLAVICIESSCVKD